MLNILDFCWNDYKAEALDYMIATKKAEVECFITKHISGKKWLPKLEQIAKHRFKQTKTFTEYHTIPMISQLIPWDHVGMLVPDWLRAEYHNWRMDLPHIAEHILSLTQNIGMAKLEKKIAKTMLKEKADIDMTDMGTSQTMQQTMSDKVKKAVAPTLKPKVVSAPPSSEFTHLPSSCSEVNPFKRKSKVQDSNRREGRVYEGST
jgi:hypothetical protein